MIQGALGSEAPMTRALLALCVLVFALSMASDQAFPIWITAHFTVSTMLRFGALYLSLGSFEPWRYLAAVFVHLNVLHILMNGWSLTAVGPAAEREFGSARFVVLFVLTGILGFWASDRWYGGWSPPTAGASGAICGIVGSVIGVAYARRDPNWKQLLTRNAVNLAILGLALPVNNAAHVGGLVSGAVLGFLFTKERRAHRFGVLFVPLAGLLLLLSLASVVLSAASPIWRAQRSAEIRQRG